MSQMQRMAQQIQPSLSFPAFPEKKFHLNLPGKKSSMNLDI